jgi:ABC-type nitrate/sulfonate/bicarbonate transport system substrate-binding protein
MKRARALSLLAAAALPAVPRPARAQLAPIRLAVSTNDSYAEPYYAADAGFFTRAGLDVQLTNFATSAEIRTAVLANAIDVGQTDVTPIANAVSHGIPLAFFAGAAKYAKAAPTTLLCVGKQSTIRTAKDLEGQTVATISFCMGQLAGATRTMTTRPKH